MERTMLSVIGFGRNLVKVMSLVFIIVTASAVFAQDATTTQNQIPGGCDCLSAGPFDFKAIPPISILPRTGPFPNPPKDCGYYSLLDQIRGNYLESPPKYGYPA